jgi:hypothetical protein
MAMTTRGTRGSSNLMQLGKKPAAKAAAPATKLTPLFPGTKLEDGKTYRLPIKKGSRGKGTRLG